MPVTTRGRKAPEPTADPQQLINPSSASASKRNSSVTYKDDDPFEAAFNTFNDSSSESESDVSDYARPQTSSTRKRLAKYKKAVKKRKTSQTIPGPALDPPELSDHELGDEDEDDSIVSNRRTAFTPATNASTNSPSIIRLDVGGNTTINLNIADLIQRHGLHSNICSPLARQLREVQSASGSAARQDLFMKLPPEIRNRIYRMILVTDAPIVFHARTNFERSGQFLRTCRKIAQEAVDVMYGENSFHFERTAERRGKFWEKEWKEVGFKDIRRFLETIGPVNISKMKYTSFLLEDGAPYLNQGVDQAERRFVNDPVLQRIFNLIAADTVLSRIDVMFCPRAQVQLTDYHFLKSLSGIKAASVKFPEKYSTRVTKSVLDRLLPIMTVADTDAADIDETKVKSRIKMQFDKPTKASYSTFAW